MNKISLLLFQNKELLTLTLLSILIIGILTYFLKPNKTFKDENEKLQKKSYFVDLSISSKKWSKWDTYFIVLLTGLYTLISFWKLGNFNIPTTYWQPSINNQEIIFKTDGLLSYDSFSIIGGEGDNNSNEYTYQIGLDDIEIYGSMDGSTYEEITTIEDSSYMQYKIYTLDQSYNYIKLVVPSINSVINEICVYESSTQRKASLTIVEDNYASSKYPATLLIDEQEQFVINPTYMDETYFDEIYHVRNAVEIVNQQYMYASVHPLFGTNLMALGIAIIGNNPFGWRFMGALFGVLMVPLFYLITKRLFRSERYCFIATLLFCCDFMHITTSRIATLEPFSVFFILLMFYFMIHYFYTSYIDTSFKKQLGLLGLCGISMGVAWSTKWTGCYSSLGLALLFFINYFSRFKEYRIAKAKHRENEYEDVHEQLLVDKVLAIYPKRLQLTFIYCCFVFVIVPVIIYFTSHIVDHIWRDGYSLTNMIDQIMYMYNYHSDLTATHPFQSQWYQWILDIRPIWYYIKRSGIYAQSISCFSNPILTLGCFASMFVCGYQWFKHKTTSLTIIFIGFLTALGPWMLVSRCVFAYHFYPSTPFYILMSVFTLRLIEQYFKTKRYTKIFVITCVVVFILFLPATCGFQTTQSYLDSFLSWMPSWNLN